jgi:trimethylamine--corrinoid protein Co-methyltransferase
MERINEHQMHWIQQTSLALLDDPGVVCFNQQAADIFDNAGCQVKTDPENANAWRVRIPAKVVKEAIDTAPGQVVLGARDPQNALFLDADVPHAYFGTGSETNIYLKTEMAEFVKKDDPSVSISAPVFTQERGSIRYLCESAKLCNALPNVDFFIRNVNIQDDGISPENKDVNVFFASLLHMTKHVQAGLVNPERLDNVLKLAEILAGGEEQLRRNPIVSFITCVIKSPLQMVEDTAEKLIRIAQKGVPVVISSSPQGGSTAPIREEGMVAMINAEILTGITLTQLVNPGTPVLYGAVPVRARLDTLHDFYGAPEFIHYNIDCIQLARDYQIPCYSTAGVGDAKVPGIQSTIEKLFSQLQIAAAGAQYIHYAFGLLEKTNMFCPVQAVLDDAHIGIVRDIVRQANFTEDDVDAGAKEVRKVMTSKTKLFAKYIRKAKRRGLVSDPYLLETDQAQDLVIANAVQRLQDILNGPGESLEDAVIEQIYREVPGLLPRETFEIDN